MVTAELETRGQQPTLDSSSHRGRGIALHTSTRSIIMNGLDSSPNVTPAGVTFGILDASRWPSHVQVLLCAAVSLPTNSWASILLFLAVCRIDAAKDERSWCRQSFKKILTMSTRLLQPPFTGVEATMVRQHQPLRQGKAVMRRLRAATSKRKGRQPSPSLRGRSCGDIAGSSGCGI